MAIDLGSQTLTTTRQERTWRIECFCDDGTDYKLVAHREILTKDQDGNIISMERFQPSVVRTVSQIQNEADALQFLGLGKTLCDRWAQEDAQAAAAEAAAQAADTPPAP